MGKRLTRRDFLAYSLATGVTIWTVHELAGLPLGKKTELQHLLAIDPVNAASPIFPQSVASGDPQPHGITLWTRVEPQQSGPIVLLFQVAQDPNFKQLVLAGYAVTTAAKDYTAKVQVHNTALQPFTTYYYRFIHNNAVSPVGRFKTLPARRDHITKVRFAYISCQDYTNGFYTAMRFLSTEEVDFVVHLGDYIYEQVYGGVRPIQALPSGEKVATTLEDYRYLYRTYRSDPNLQRLHEQFAFIAIWDDHEFANDAYRQYSIDTPDESQNRNPRRRRAANRAWAEYIPAAPDFEPDEGAIDSIQIYRSFVFGDLMELVMTDERLYRDGPPCGLQEQPTATNLEARYFTPGCANLKNPARSMLGKTQRQWFLSKMVKSTRTWKIWGNEVMTLQFKIKAQFSQALFGIPLDLFFTLDQWDGYPAERQFIFSLLDKAGVKNFVTITGDLHTFIAGYQLLNFDDPTSKPIGVEFVGGSISSSNIAEQRPDLPTQVVNNVAYASNPHFKFFNSATHGYTLVEVTPEAMTVTYRSVSTITDLNATVSTLAAFKVPKDQVLIQPI
ncbi:hypothetical protein BST81_14110 [Leptolyngbya sp. 'hensonii']|uniref:alkaline phosphatase D family protein n=1 Tax=Leptolyngbya sp. 'hensonii' TaxID=1922337 RepID=UPI00094F9875|nr:alkaline phosphatase D family protein [Leptolyngbya sp. 'hensonii']OLP18147.1 hypothetical protein BST81_14110 [Leptolyngbya sp. 'hensonii']